MSLTTDRNDPRLIRKEIDNNGKVPQNEVYLVLSNDEINKGFIRPLRQSYIHVGRKMNDGIELLDNPYIADNGNVYTALANIVIDGKKLGGKYLTESELNEYNDRNGYIGGCDTLTKMNITIAETYARDPDFYGATYCCGCQKHLPLSEFIWEGTNDIVGS
jgi:hypothetical protein